MNRFRLTINLKKFSTRLSQVFKSTRVFSAYSSTSQLTPSNRNDGSPSFVTRQTVNSANGILCGLTFPSLVNIPKAVNGFKNVCVPTSEPQVFKCVEGWTAGPSCLLSFTSLLQNVTGESLFYRSICNLLHNVGKYIVCPFRTIVDGAPQSPESRSYDGVRNTVGCKNQAKEPSHLRGSSGENYVIEKKDWIVRVRNRQRLYDIRPSYMHMDHRLKCRNHVIVSKARLFEPTNFKVLSRKISMSAAKHAQKVNRGRRYRSMRCSDLNRESRNRKKKERICAEKEETLKDLSQEEAIGSDGSGNSSKTPEKEENVQHNACNSNKNELCKRCFPTNDNITYYRMPFWRRWYNYLFGVKVEKRRVGGACCKLKGQDEAVYVREDLRKARARLPVRKPVLGPCGKQQERSCEEEEGVTKLKRKEKRKGGEDCDEKKAMDECVAEISQIEKRFAERTKPVAGWAKQDVKERAEKERAASEMMKKKAIEAKRAAILKRCAEQRAKQMEKQEEGEICANRKPITVESISKQTSDFCKTLVDLCNVYKNKNSTGQREKCVDRQPKKEPRCVDQSSDPQMPKRYTCGAGEVERKLKLARKKGTHTPVSFVYRKKCGADRGSSGSKSS